MPRVDIGARVVPALLVRDMAETIAFYRRLGFEPEREDCDWAASPWVEVRRGALTLQFHTEPPCGTPPEPVCSGTFYFYPAKVRALAEELRGQVEFAWGPEAMDYGMFEFGVRDPNGYYLAFAEPA